jgi:sporadic carbohydrate cluster protein (TIGR04323 family)
MKPRHPALGSVIEFDESKYPFGSLFLERVRSTLPATSGLEDLSLLHDVVGPSSINAIYDGLYALTRERPFRALYQRLVQENIAGLFDSPFHFQRVPGIRIHTPNSRTVQYHSDYWYGHGPEVVNFWMPITRSFGTNALFVATLEDSLTEIDTIVAQKLRQPEIDERLQAICKPVELQLGGIKVFNAQTAHGSLPNTTGRTRISVDFRILVEGCDPGSKDVREYYASGSAADPFTTTGVASEETIRVGAYIFPKHGFTRFVPATSQRAVVEAYAKQKHLQIVTEETEIFPMTHHPTLLNLAAGKGAQSVAGVLLFSVLCLPRDPALRKEIYETARTSGTTLFFANENLVFPGKDTTRDIETALERAEGL